MKGGLTRVVVRWATGPRARPESIGRALLVSAMAGTRGIVAGGSSRDDGQSSPQVSRQRPGVHDVDMDEERDRHLYDDLVRRLHAVQASIELLESADTAREDERARLAAYQRNRERLASELNSLRLRHPGGEYWVGPTSP
jgi:hypothetical protein